MQWRQAINAILKQAGLNENFRFDVGAVTHANLDPELAFFYMTEFYQLMRERVRYWTTVNHHQSHATYAFYDSPFPAAMVFSMDGGGNDGAFRMGSSGVPGTDAWLLLLSLMLCNLCRGVQCVLSRQAHGSDQTGSAFSESRHE